MIVQHKFERKKEKKLANLIAGIRRRWESLATTHLLSWKSCIVDQPGRRTIVATIISQSTRTRYRITSPHIRSTRLSPVRLIAFSLTVLTIHPIEASPLNYQQQKLFWEEKLIIYFVGWLFDRCGTLIDSLFNCIINYLMNNYF